MEIIKTAIDLASLWINVGIVMAGGGQQLAEIKPCKTVVAVECRVIVYPSTITVVQK